MSRKTDVVAAGADTTTIPADGRGVAAISSPIYAPVLTLVDTDDLDRVGERILLGSHPVALSRTSTVFPGGPLADGRASRSHAEVDRSPSGGYVLRDMGSRNGSFVNGNRIVGSGQPLTAGDVVQIGDTLLLFHDAQVPPPPDAKVEGLLGRSNLIREVRSSIARYAAATATAPVLVLGETGTGKELVARAIAGLGRPSGPFVALSAIETPRDLVAATLFGHGRGAFTGAAEARKGVFRAADRGTLFLDEVGELDASIQATLLRVLQEQEVRPVGADAPVRVDVRLVAATNRDLLELVRDGTFRADLYSRLAYLTVRQPALRDRPDDVALLARHFAQQAIGSAGSDTRFTPEAMTALLRHSWPFNVRELKAAVELALAEWPGEGRVELPSALLAQMEAHREAFTSAGRGPETTPALNRAAIEAALTRHGGNMSHAAADLGKDRGQLYRMVRKLGIDPGTFRAGE